MNILHKLIYNTNYFTKQDLDKYLLTNTIEQLKTDIKTYINSKYFTTVKEGFLYIISHISFQNYYTISPTLLNRCNIIP